IWVIILIICIIGIVKINNLAHDGARYEHKNGFTIVKYLSPKSILLNSNIEIEDTLISINDNLIKNKHFLYNKIFEQHKPNEILRYTLQKNGERKHTNITLQHYFPKERRRYIIVMSMIILLLSLIFNIKTRVKNNLFYAFYSLYLIIPLLIIYLNIPFSNQWMYMLSILSSGALLINLYITNSLLLYNTLKRKSFLIILIPLLLITIIWILFYFKWTMDLNSSTYQLLNLSMKGFHLYAVFIIVYCVSIIVFKVFNVSHSVINRRILIFIGVYIFLLLLYPIFLALPVIMRNGELIHFDMYLGLFSILLLILIYNNKILIKDK
ncbi:hypothetical protein KAU15_03060, partial [candidate division WOR-3 bacterium]|nr:hypothetical protein [candidate division WOR-3 bacterium]